MEPEGVIEVRLDPSHHYPLTLGKAVPLALFFGFWSGGLVNAQVIETQDSTVLRNIKLPGS